MPILKKILVIALCIQTLLPNRLLRDIVRLPVLIVHYFHHNNSDTHIHFQDFIAEHYSHTEDHSKDHRNHNNLPFHNHDLNLQQNISPVAVLDTCQILMPNSPLVNCKTEIISRQHFFLSATLSSIWRPPKLT